jgi:TPR repeat protein
VARAQNNIGACFAEGLGVERDLKLAAQWLSLSAAGGDAVGQRNLAALYFKGEGVAQDYARLPVSKAGSPTTRRCAHHHQRMRAALRRPRAA